MTTSADPITLSPAAAEWLVSGEQGISSRTMFNWLALGRRTAVLGGFSPGHPYDFDDFQRCERLLRQVPELRPLLPRMASFDEEWAALVRRWDDIVRVAEEEVPGFFEKPRYSRPWPTKAGILIDAVLDVARSDR